MLDLDWDDEEVTRPSVEPAATSTLVGLMPMNPRIQIIGIHETGAAPASADEEFDERETTEREAITTDSPTRRAKTKTIDMGLPPPARAAEGPPSWDDQTVPRHDGELRARARKLANLHERVERETRRKDTVVDGTPPSAVASLGADLDADLSSDLNGAPPSEIPSERPTLESSSPSILVGELESVSFAETDVMAPTEAAGSDAVSAVAETPIGPGPMTQPRESSFAPRSIELDVSHLDAMSEAFPAFGQRRRSSAPPPGSERVSLSPESVPVSLTGLEGPASEVFPRPVTDFRPLEEHRVTPPTPRAPTGPSVPPMTMSSGGSMPPPRRRANGGAIAAIGVAMILCVTIFVLWLLPKRGALVVKLRTDDGSPAAKAEIYVDGTKRCDTDPCVIKGLSKGDFTVKVIVPGTDQVRAATVSISAGEHETLWIDVPSAQQAKTEEEPEGPTPIELEPTHRLTLGVTTAGARVVLIPDGGVGRVIKGPFPTTLDLEAGRYEVVASKHGYAAFVAKLKLDDEQPQQSLEIVLERRTATPASVPAPVVKAQQAAEDAAPVEEAPVAEATTEEPPASPNTAASATEPLE